MTKKRFYLALRGQDKDADVEDALWQLADVLAGEGRIYVENMLDLEGFVSDKRYIWIGEQIEKARKEREEHPENGYKTLWRCDEEKLEERLRQEFGALPVYELTIRKIGFVDDNEEPRFHPVGEDKKIND